jgi:NTE family protein
MRLGLVLGAGGRAGVAYHRGVLRALESLGADPRGAAVIVGTSAGSIVGASLRRDAPPIPPLTWRDRPPRNGLPERSAVLELARRPREGLNALLLRPDIRLGQLDIAEAVVSLRRSHSQGWPAAPLWLVAVRRTDGRRVAFGRPGAPAADVAAAVAASCAVPGYVRPVRIGDVEYVDGGVHSPTNADLLADVDLDLVVVSSPMSVDPRASRLRLDLPIRLRFHRFLRTEVWALRRDDLRVVTVEPDQATVRAMGSMLNSGNMPEIEGLAYAHARRRLEAGPGSTV